MKKMIVILALVMVACAPAMAAVTISGTRSGTTVTISYTAPGNSIRAFGMDISVDSGTITGVNCSNASYWVYPGSIQISGGTVTGSGTCVCASTYPGTKGGVGTSAVTVEMGSLYTGSAPATSGTLLTLTLSTSDANTIVARNTGRGGVVMEDPDESAGDNLPLTIPGGGAPPECYPSSKGDYNVWVTLGKPTCWCFPRQCYGDADGSDETPLKTTYHIAYNDLTILLDNWKDKVSELAGVCADFDHDTETPLKTTYRVAYNDLNILLANWKDKASAPDDCNAP
jgi:hypothetical protein